MMRFGRTRGLCLAVFALALAGCFGAFQSTPDEVQTVGGLTPNVEDKDAGLVAIANGFNLKTYRVIAVDKFAVTDPAMKDDGDRRTAAQMSAFFQSELVRHMRGTGLFARVVNLSEGNLRPGADKALRLEGVITRLGEGSQAMRAIFGLYGAGRARAQAEMRLVDAQSRRVLLVTADRRVGSVGAFGGAAKDYWKESFDDMARDLGKFFVRLAQGQAPAK